jgi:nitroreductase
MTGMSVSEAVGRRRSIRAYLDKPVDLSILRGVMDRARFAPSGCNFQPWEATILTGEPLRMLQEKMLSTPYQEPEEYEVTPAGITPPYLARLYAVGEGMYGAQGIARDDKEARKAFMTQNFVSFGAPALLLCYLPRFMGLPQWSDVGMWLQTVMLLLQEAGLDSCPQEFLSYHGRLIKEHIGVSDESHIFFCGVAIGYGDAAAPVNGFARERVPLDEQVKFIGF